MADEKNFEPSSKKKKKAKKDGQIAKSRELTQAMQLTTCYLSIFYIPNWCHTFINLYHKIHEVNNFTQIEKSFAIWWRLFEVSGLMVGTFCLALVLITVITELSQVGFNISFEKIKPKISNIDPVSGVKKLFGGGENGGSPLKSVSEVLQLIVLGMVIAGILWWYSLSLTINFVTMDVGNFENIFVVSEFIIKNLCHYLIIASVIFGIFKYYLSRKRIRKQLMMDFEELKREYKEDEGDPHTKSERKAIHHELLLNGVMEVVKKAKVIVSDF